MPAEPPDDADVADLMRRLVDEAVLPDETDLDEVVRRLADQVRALEAVVPAQQSAGERLVAALVDQFVAGQSEALFGLQSASADVGRSLALVRRAVADLPEELTPALSAIVEELTTAAANAVQRSGAAIGASLDRQSTELTAALNRSSVELLELADLVGKRSSYLSESLEQAAVTFGSVVDEQTTAAADKFSDLLAHQLTHVLESVEQATTAFSTAVQNDARLTADHAAVLSEAAASFSGLVQKDSEHAAAAVTEALAAGSSDVLASLARAREELDSAVVAMQQDIHDLEGAISQASSAGVERLASAHIALLSGATTAEESAKTSAAALADAGTGVRDAVQALTGGLAELVHDAEARLVSTAESMLTGVEHAARAFGDDTASVTEAMSKVGESFVANLLSALDERDRRDKLLEDRLNARVDRLTVRTVEAISEVSAAFAVQVDRLEARDVTERQSAAAELRQIVDRLLAEPRGKLKEARATLITTDEPVEVRPRPRRKRSQAEDEP